ncbi:MAG: choice-of-anchor J domain-containing protein [Calditrichota bacterium]
MSKTKYLVLAGGLLLAFLLVGHLALNAAGVGPTVIDKPGSKISKTLDSKNSSPVISAEELEAKAAEEAQYGTASRSYLSPELRKELEETARLAGMEPFQIGEFSDLELMAALRNVPSASKSVTSEQAEIAASDENPEAAKRMYELLELEKGVRSGASGTLDEPQSPFSGPEQRDLLESRESGKTETEKPEFEVETVSEEPIEAPTIDNSIEGILARIAAGEEISAYEKELLNRHFENEGYYNHGSEGSLDNVGGPDAGGYSFVDNVAPDTATYDWIELKGDPQATFLTQSGTDGGISWFNLGFSFPFYNVLRDSVCVSNDGNLQFTTSSTAYSNAALPSTAINGPVIFAFWDDQKTSAFGGTTSDRILYRNFANYTVVEWDSLVHYSTTCDSMALKYEVILYNSGKIKMQYNIIASEGTCDSSVTVGIQSNGAAGSPALQYCYGSSGTNFTGPHPAAGRAIWFYPVAYTNNFATAAITSPSGTGVYGPSSELTVSATFVNAGSATQTAPVKYSFNGGATIEETSANLVQWASDPHTFATTITTPAITGSYPLTVWTDLATDENRANDTVRINVNVFTGGSCDSPIILASGIGTDSATYNNCGAGHNDPGIPCNTNSYDDMVFQKSVDPGHTVTFWISSLTWVSKYPGLTLRWGGACPGTNVVDCIATSTSSQYYKHFTWTNSTGSTQNVYFVVGHYSGTTSSYCGDFKLAWKDQVCAAVDPPLNQGFESVPAIPILPNCWTQENPNGISPVWESYGTNPRTGTRCGTISSVAAGNDDWLFSPGINMEEGREYFVKYWRRVGSATYPDSMEVMAGLAPTAAAMNISVAAMDTSMSTVYVQKLGGFTAPTSDVYYIGWHNVTSRNSSTPRTYIDDIEIDASTECTGGEVTVTSVVGENEATLNAVLSGGWSGGVPRYQWYTGVDCVNGNQIPGETLSSFTTTTSGTYSCRVYIIDSLTCVDCDSAIATVIDCGAGTYGFSEGFELVATPNLPLCWLQQNLDTYTYTWNTYTTTPHSGLICARVYGYVSGGGAPNDWLLSQAVVLSSDTTYLLGYWVRLSSSSYTLNLGVYAGTTQDNTAMTTSLETEYQVTNTEWGYHEVSFTPPSSGLYYIGWQATAASSQSGYIYLDDIALWPQGACTPPSSVTVNAATGADSAKLEAVALGGTGGAYEYQWYTGIDCQTGNEIVGANTDSLWVFSSGSYSCKAWIVDDVDCALCDSGYADVIDCDVPLTLPINEGFETTTGTLLPTCWIAEDVNGDGRPWRTNTVYPRTGARYAYNQYSTGTATDDWMFTRGIALTANDTIVVDYWYRCSISSSSYTESLELMAGTAPTAASMTAIVDTNFIFSQVATYTQRSGLFVVPATGTYYFGWHAGYLINQGGVCVDDIAIYEYGNCGAPAVNVPAAASQTFVTLTCNTTGGYGGPVQYQWYTGETCLTGNEIPGANTAQYTTFNSGIFSCKAWFYDPATCGACDSAVATVLPDPCLPGLVPPVYEPLASSGLPTCWSQENGNGDSYSWNTSSTYYYSSPYAAYLYTSSTPANDWLFSGPVYLTQDSTYRIQYWRRASSTSYMQTLELAVGTNRHSSAMTTILLPPYSFNNTGTGAAAFILDVAEYTAPATGSYYFGLHNITSVSSGSVYADDFRIYKVGECGAPTSVTAAAAVGPDSAALTATVVGGFGGEIQYQWYTGLTCDPLNLIPGATGQTYYAPVSGVYSCKAYYVNAETCGLCDSAMATVIPCATNPYNDWPNPFVEGFEGLTTPNLPECWRQQDVNGDARVWGSSASYYRTGSRSGYISYSLSSSGLPVDDWMYTKALSLTAGDTMNVDYWYRCALTSSSYTEALEVLAGTGARADLMSIEVDPLFTFSAVSTHQLHQAYFVVPTTGTYFVGWHCLSANNQGGIAVDDITIYKRGTCTAPTIDVPAISYPAWATLTATASGGFGSAIQYQWYTGTDCVPGNEIAGATTNQYTTLVSGVFSCRASRDSCGVCDSAEATVTIPQAGEICSNALTLTLPASNDSTVVSGTTVGFYSHCPEICGDAQSYGPDLFYTMTIPGSGDADCRRLAFALSGAYDPFLVIYDGLDNCCNTALYCNDDHGLFSPLPPWDVAGQHPLVAQESYIAAELYPGTYLIRVAGWIDSSGAYTLKVYDNGPCFDPCDPAENLTVYLSPTDPTKMWLRFDANALGTYKIFSTLVKNNDGDPDNGEDPDWSLDTTIEVTTIGVVTWTDLRTWVAYRNYAVMHDCPVIGRCCYGDLTDPDCEDNTLPECDALMGVWNRYLRCTTDPCPVSGAGETCETAIYIPSFPYSTGDVSTAGFANDYQLPVDEGVPQCLPSYPWYYTQYNDVLYRIVLTTTTSLQFTLVQPGWGSLTIHTACPASGTCIGGVKSPTAGTLVSPCYTLAAGTYFVMIDSWTSAPIDYSMSIDVCTP